MDYVDLSERFNQSIRLTLPPTFAGNSGVDTAENGRFTVRGKSRTYRITLLVVQVAATAAVKEEENEDQGELEDPLPGLGDKEKNVMDQFDKLVKEGKENATEEASKLPDDDPKQDLEKDFAAEKERMQ